MTNILHFIDTYKTGGPGKTIINSAKYINCEKFKIHVASFVNEEVFKSEFMSSVLLQGIPFLALSDQARFNLQHLTELRRYILENNIKILHTHGYKTDMIGLILNLLIKDLILVTTHHGWITNNKLQKFYVNLNIFLSKFFDGVIVVSKELRKMLPNKLRNSEKAIIIHNAIVLENYQNQNKRKAFRENYSIGDDQILIGVIGRLSIEKGSLVMLEAFNQLQSIFSNAKLVYVGDGLLLSELENKINFFNLRENVILAGHQNPVQPFYEAIDIFVLPSLTEGLSNVILEAMAYKLPIVATCVGGNPEIIDNQCNGILVKSNNAIALKDAIFEIIRNRELKHLLAKEGYKTVINRFNFKVRMEKVEDFYFRLMESEYM